MRSRVLLVGCAVAWVLTAGAARGAPGDLLRTFSGGGQFGNSIAVSGNEVLIGAPHAYSPEHGSGGAAYLFDGTSGALLRTFWCPGPAGTALTFGTAVAAAGGNYVVGGPDCGLYLFDGSTGQLLRAIQDPVPTQDDQFGACVAAFGSHLLVGDPGDSALNSHAGAVYLMDPSTGGLLRTFSAPDPTHHGQFGYSIAVSGPNVLVGTPDGDPMDNVGVAYLFDASTGVLRLTLNNPLGGDGYWYFGSAVAAHGNQLLVSGTSYSDRGGVFRFDGATGATSTRYISPDFDSADNFGCSVAAVGDDVLVGAYTPADGRGAFLFRGATGDPLLTLRDPAPGEPGAFGPRYGSYFGESVAAFGGDVLVSAPGAGSVYLFEGVPEPCTVCLLAAGAPAGAWAMWRWRRAARRRQQLAERRSPCDAKSGLTRHDPAA
jgi:hypothetical protein